MKISKKFLITLLLSVFAIATINIVAFYVFYTSYIKLYLSDKISQREDITVEYINSIIEKQALDDVDDLFSSVEIEFFELLDIYDGAIPIDDASNLDIIVEYLSKSGVSPKYIEEVIPENNLQKILEDLKDESSPESMFLQRLFYSMVFLNIILLFVFSIVILYFTRKIVTPINRATQEISSLIPGTGYSKIIYEKHDEIGLLIESINSLNGKLSVQEKIRNRLIADISHELKTPITSIQCYLEGISDGIIKLTDSTLSSIMSEMDRLIRLVNTIMEFEKFENTTLSPNKQKIQAAKLCKDLRVTLKQTLSDKNQKIVISGEKDAEILADQDLFTQLLYNIVGNFQKYAGEDTTLRIMFEKGTVEFKDNGAGIPKEKTQYLFDKFYQGNSEKTGDIGSRGIGVGLSIVHKIVLAHKWSIKISSDTGSGFSIKVYMTSHKVHT